MTDLGARERASAGFESARGGRPSRLVRAPGRVNLIGEHIDYCGLPVLPMALERAVWLAFRPVSGARVRIATDLDGLPPREFEAAPAIPGGPAGDWGNYPRAAVQSVCRAAALSSPRGFDAFVATDVPPAAGLSSSSALVVGAALAWLDSNGEEVGDRLELARILAAGERYVGTAGGGMDQAACLLGRAGHAIRIGFDPLSADPIPLPRGWRFAVAHSGERAEKSGSARAAYNARTREAGEAARGILKALDLDEPEGPALRCYPGLLRRFGPERLLAAGRRLRPTLRRRLRHIVTEAERVETAGRALRDGDVSSFGAALTASHESLRTDYEVSTPALDRLVAAALDAGAAGARLTGAGLGGCAIAVCDPPRAPAVLEALAAVPRRAGGVPEPFLARAGDGACVLEAGGLPG